MRREANQREGFPSELDKVSLDGGYSYSAFEKGYQGQSHETKGARHFESVTLLPALLTGAAVGVLLAMFWDPVAGRGRRARMRDQAVKAGHELQWQAGRKARDLGHRLQGVQARMMKQVLVDDQPDGAVLVARVRSALGHHASHSRSISVEADKGVVTLKGPVLSSELDEVLQTVETVRGVRAIKNEMRVFESKDNVPGLQGESRIEKRQ